MTSPTEALDAKYRVFATLWATCLLFDLVNRGLASSPAAALVSSAVVGVLVFPGSTALLAAAGALYVANALTRTGAAYVHWYFDALVSAALALSWLERALVGRTVRVGEADLLAAFAPAGRALAVLALGFAGFAKLNTMFLDPDQSCGSALYLAQAHAPGFRGVLPDATWARATAIGLTLVAELGVAAALLVGALRPLAIVVGTVFLFLLGINPVGRLYEFAGPVVALLFLFTDDEVPARVLTRMRRMIGRLAPWGPTVRVAAGAVLALGLLTAVVSGEEPAAVDVRTAVCRAVWCAGLPTLLVLYLWHVAPRARRSALRGGAVGAWLVPLAMLANEASPYLGFPHDLTFTMASDLRSLRGHSNHLLIHPPALSDNRVVRILASDDPFLRRVKWEDARLDWVSLRHHLAGNRGIEVTFQVDGEPEPRIVGSGGDRRGFRSRPLLGPLLMHSEQPAWRRCGHWHHPAVRDAPTP